MTTLDVLKAIQRLTIEKLIAKSELVIAVYARPHRRELSIFVQDKDYVVLAHEIFVDDNSIDFRKQNEEAYKRVLDAIEKHDSVSLAG